MDRIVHIEDFTTREGRLLILVEPLSGCGRAACLRRRPANAAHPIDAHGRRLVRSDCSAGPLQPVPDLPRTWRSTPSRDTTDVPRTDLTPYSKHHGAPASARHSQGSGIAGVSALGE